LPPGNSRPTSLSKEHNPSQEQNPGIRKEQAPVRAGEGSAKHEPLRFPSSADPIGTVLLTIGIALAGIAAFFVLPVSPLAAGRLPRDLGQGLHSRREPGDHGHQRGDAAGAASWHVIAGVNEMTSNSGTGSTRVTCSST
jgi:hypothetical protein